MVEEQHGRMDGIDVARALGLVLVYYGHFIEQVMYLKNPDAALHYKWIYSFHMVLFFVLSGWARGFKPWSNTLQDFVRATLAGRIVPYLFFSLLVAALSLVLPGWFPVADLTTSAGYLQGVLATALGFPLFNIPMWFVACLVSVECLHRLAGPLLHSTNRILLAVLVCYVGGYGLNSEYFFFGQNRNFWFVHEVPVVYAFYLLGVLAGRQGFLPRITRPMAAVGFLVGLAVVQLTFDQNQGPFRYLQAVVIVLSGHGHFVWFPLTALAGTAMMLCLGQLLRSYRWLVFLGRNALILLGLNGLFYHFANAPLAAWAAGWLPGGGWAVLGAGAVVTAGSVVLSVPLIYLLNLTLPHLVGKPRSQGLLFGPLLRS